MKPFQFFAHTHTHKQFNSFNWLENCTIECVTMNISVQIKIASKQIWKQLDTDVWDPFQNGYINWSNKIVIVPVNDIPKVPTSKVHWTESPWMNFIIQQNHFMYSKSKINKNENVFAVWIHWFFEWEKGGGGGVTKRTAKQENKLKIYFDFMCFVYRYIFVCWGYGLYGLISFFCVCVRFSYIKTIEYCDIEMN